MRRTHLLAAAAIASLLGAACTSSAAQAAPSHPPTPPPARFEPATPPVPSVAPTAVAVVASPSPAPSPSPGFAPTAPPSRRPPAAPLPAFLAGPSFTLHVPILMYHRIVPANQAGDSLPGLVVSPQLFDSQLALLHSAGWHAVTVAEIAQALARQQPLPPRTFAISIDDGWADGYTYALPILQHYGYHATYFVPAGRVGVLVNFLSPAELRTLAADGMEIADHTYSGDQIVLTDLSIAQMQYQIQAAAQRLAGIVGRRPVTFAYPAGRFDLAAEQLLNQDGFTMAVIEGAQGYDETWLDRYAVPRLRVSPGTSPQALLGEMEAIEPGA